MSFETLKNKINLERFNLIVYGDIAQRDYYKNVLPFIIGDGTRFNIFFYLDKTRSFDKPFFFLIDNFSSNFVTEDQIEGLIQKHDKSGFDSNSYVLVIDKNESLELYQYEVEQAEVQFDIDEKKEAQPIDQEKVITYDIDNSLSIINKEYEMSKIWKDVTEKLSREIGYLTRLNKKASKQLIIYVFFIRLIIVDDIYTFEFNESHENALRKYLRFQNLEIHVEKLLEMFKKAYDSAAGRVKNLVLQKDDLITEGNFESFFGNLFFKYRDFRCLIRNGEDNPMLVNKYVIASCMRYHYMDLGTIGLAVVYKDLGYLPQDNVLEAFSATINRYFDNYCSAFLDVDIDSQGNFFALERVDQPIVLVNPPYEINIMSWAMDKCYDLYLINPEITFMFVLPDWKEWPELNILVQKSFLVKRFKKEEKVFKDYHGLKEIHPVDTVYCYYGKEREIDERGKILMKDKLAESTINLYEPLALQKFIFF